MKKPNKYNPQTCNRTGEAIRRLKALYRRDYRHTFKYIGYTKFDNWGYS